jgi:hypothetical protein
MFAIAEAIDQPLQFRLRSVALQPFHRFLHALAQQFRTASQFVTPILIIHLHLEDSEQQRHAGDTRDQPQRQSESKAHISLN